jgi:hypothetical protein
VLGIPKDIAEDGDHAAINAALFERNRNRSTPDVLDELKRVYANLVNKLESTPFEELLKPCFDDDPEKRPVLMLVLGSTTDHFTEHRRTIEKTL